MMVMRRKKRRRAMIFPPPPSFHVLCVVKKVHLGRPGFSVPGILQDLHDLGLDIQIIIKHLLGELIGMGQ